MTKTTFYFNFTYKFSKLLQMQTICSAFKVENVEFDYFLQKALVLTSPEILLEDLYPNNIDFGCLHFYGVGKDFIRSDDSIF